MKCLSHKSKIEKKRIKRYFTRGQWHPSLVVYGYKEVSKRLGPGEMFIKIDEEWASIGKAKYVHFHDY